MRTGWETYPIELSGGLITNISPIQQGAEFPGSAINLINFEPSIEGGYKKILGYEKWNTNPLPGEEYVKGVALIRDRDAIAFREGKYYLSIDKSAWEEKLDLQDNLARKSRHTVFNFNGVEKFVFVDGVHKPVFYNTSSQTMVLDNDAPSDVTGATRVAEFKNHLFFGVGSKLVFTAPYDETNYNTASGAGVIDVGARITGIVPFRESLIIFSVDRINRIQGNTSEDFILQPITSRTGAMCGDTIQEVGGDIMYLGPDGVRFLSATERIGDFALQRASENIQNKITQAFTDCGSYSSYVIRSKNQYRLHRWDEGAIKETARGFLCTRYLDQQYTEVAWAETRGLKIYDSDSKQFGSFETVVFCTDEDYIYQLESTSSFDGNAIEAVFQTPFMPITDPQIRKTFYKHNLYLNPEGSVDLQVSLVFDYDDDLRLQPNPFTLSAESEGSFFWDSTETIWDDFLWTEKTKRRLFKSLVNGSGFTVSVEYRENSTNDSMSLDTVVLEFKQNDRK